MLSAKISALPSENVGKHEFLTGKDVLSETDLLGKAETMKRFQYSPLGKELKVKTDIAKEQYQKLCDTSESDKIILKKSTNN